MLSADCFIDFLRAGVPSLFLFKVFPVTIRKLLFCGIFKKEEREAAENRSTHESLKKGAFFSDLC